MKGYLLLKYVRDVFQKQVLGLTRATATTSVTTKQPFAAENQLTSTWNKSQTLLINEMLRRVLDSSQGDNPCLPSTEHNQPRMDDSPPSTAMTILCHLFNVNQAHPYLEIHLE